MSLPAECSVRSLAKAAHTWGRSSIEEKWAMPENRASVRYPQAPAFLLTFLPALKYPTESTSLCLVEDVVHKLLLTGYGYDFQARYFSFPISDHYLSSVNSHPFRF